MYEVIKSKIFDKWIAKIKDRHAVTVITNRLLRFEEGNFGDVKPVGEGISEARIHYGAGYRLYFIQHREVTVVMLGGGDKSSQEKDIRKARELAKEWR